MSETLPVPAGAGAPASETLMTAIAMAAARIAAEQSRAPVAAPLTRDDVETIARAAVVEAFKSFGVDLDSVASVEAHRAVIDHARRNHAWWGKAAGNIWSAVWTAIGATLVAALVKYGNFGGGK